MNLDEIEKRAREAGFGELEVHKEDLDHGDIDWCVSEIKGEKDGSNARIVNINAEDVPRAKAKAAFLAEAPVDVLWLVARIREMESQIQVAFDKGHAAGLQEAADMADQVRPLMTPPDQRTDEKKWADIWHVGELAKNIRARVNEPQPWCAVPIAERFAQPQDFDGAEFILATSMGLFPSGMDSWFKHKGVFWSNCPLGNALGDMLVALVRGGVLTRTEDDQYKWYWDPERKDVNCPRCSYNGADPTGCASEDPKGSERCPLCDGTTRVVEGTVG